MTKKKKQQNLVPKLAAKICALKKIVIFIAITESSDTVDFF